MNPLQRLLRGWLDVDEQKHDGRKTARNLAALTDQLATLQGLIHHQTDVTLTALRHAGWQSEDDVAQTQAIQRALTIARGDGDVIVGPWTGEVGFELLYWIPFLNWLVDQGLDPSRLVVVSRGGAAPWYRHLTTRYIDVLDLLTPEQFRERTAEGKRKQYSPSRDLDRERPLNRLRLRDVVLALPAGVPQCRERDVGLMVNQPLQRCQLIRQRREIARGLADVVLLLVDIEPAAQQAPQRVHALSTASVRSSARVSGDWSPNARPRTSMSLVSSTT